MTTLQPGFRFSPTDDELISYYLKRKVMGKSFPIEAISEIDVYKSAPWDLPAKSSLKSRDLEWYFFCPQDRKYGKSSRRSRCNDIGYWKSTGKDRPILHNNQSVGMKKTLIFHRGKAPRGDRTDWVLHEYRLEDQKFGSSEYSQDAYTICKIFKKSGRGPKNSEQYGAPFCEEEWEDAYELDPRSSVCESSDVYFAETQSSLSDADWISLDLLAESLDLSPPHLDIGIEVSHSAVPFENGDALSDLGFSGQVESTPKDGIFLSDIRDTESDSQPAELYACHLLENNSTPQLIPYFPLANNSFVRHSGQAEERLPNGSSFSDFRSGDFGYHSILSGFNSEQFLGLNDLNSSFSDFRSGDFGYHSMISDFNSERLLGLNDFNLSEDHENEINVSNFAGPNLSGNHDGSTYSSTCEAEALRGWIDSGHDTSPMTNVQLPNQELIPNHTLRSAIQEWLQQHT